MYTRPAVRTYRSGALRTAVFMIQFENTCTRTYVNMDLGMEPGADPGYYLELIKLQSAPVGPPRNTPDESIG